MLVVASLLGLCAAAHSLAVPQILAERSSTTVTTVKNSNKIRFDVNGKGPLDVGNSKMSLIGNQFTIYGNTMDSGFEWYNYDGPLLGLGSISSPDLKHWTTNPSLINDSLLAAHCPATLSGGCVRPHVLYNEANKQYVLWVNAGPTSYTAFTSQSATGGFEYAASVNVSSAVSTSHGDFGLEIINGRGVIVFTALDFTFGGSIWPPFLQRIYVQYLSDDYLGTTGDAFRVTSADDDEVDRTTESPDIFERNGVFYVTASNTCGFCNGTLALVYRSASVSGPWTRQVISADSCGGQLGSVTTIESNGQTTHLGLVDLWDGATTGAALTATDSSDPWDEYEVDVGINLGRTLQDASLTATVFKYDNNSDFGIAGWKWTTLHTETIYPANITWSLDVYSILPSNVTVEAGDRLGVSLLGYAAVGYCRMEHDVAAFNLATSTNGLFLNPVGQVSGRGKDGKTSPCQPSSGKEIKWRSVVV